MAIQEDEQEDEQEELLFVHLIFPVVHRRTEKRMHKREDDEGG